MIKEERRIVGTDNEDSKGRKEGLILRRGLEIRLNYQLRLEKRKGVGILPLLTPKP